MILFDVLTFAFYLAKLGKLFKLSLTHNPESGLQLKNVKLVSE